MHEGHHPTVPVLCAVNGWVAVFSGGGLPDFGRLAQIAQSNWTKLGFRTTM